MSFRRLKLAACLLFHVLFTLDGVVGILEDANPQHRLWGLATGLVINIVVFTAFTRRYLRSRKAPIPHK